MAGTTVREGETHNRRSAQVKVLIISADGFEDSELFAPRDRLRIEGFDVDVASLTAGRIRGKRGGVAEARSGIADIRPHDYDALVLPGGKAPARLRQNRKVLEVIQTFFNAGKPIAAICHGPQILVSAGVLAGKRATCYRTIAKELIAAGARYQDAEVVVDGQIITSRQPADLPAFLRETVKQLRERSAADRDTRGRRVPSAATRPSSG